LQAELGCTLVIGSAFEAEIDQRRVGRDIGRNIDRRIGRNIRSNLRRYSVVGCIDAGI